MLETVTCSPVYLITTYHVQHVITSENINLEDIEHRYFDNTGLDYYVTALAKALGNTVSRLHGRLWL